MPGSKNFVYFCKSDVSAVQGHPRSLIIGIQTEAHSLRSQVGMGSESDCLLGQLERIWDISESVADLKVEKSGGGCEGEGV